MSALRRERDRKEATLLNQHIHRSSSEHLQGDALEVLRDATLEEYEQLLERELQPTLDYFEQVDEELIEAIPLERGGRAEFRLSRGLRLEGRRLHVAIIQNPTTPYASGNMEWGVWLLRMYTTPAQGQKAGKQ